LVSFQEKFWVIAFLMAGAFIKPVPKRRVLPFLIIQLIKLTHYLLQNFYLIDYPQENLSFFLKNSQLVPFLKLQMCQFA
jgi:hypothetical protein